jgi:membrane protease subunit HflC
MAQIYVAWRIADPRTFLERFGGDLREAERQLSPILSNAKSEVLGQYAFSDLVSTNPASFQFEKIEREMIARVRAQAESVYGITVATGGFKRLGLPESITSSVFERMRAERQRLVSSYQTEGEREARILRAQADGQANEILAQARAEAIRITGEADRKAQVYYSVFEQSPELAVFLFQLKALEESLKERTHLVLDPQTPPLNLLRGAANASAPATPRTGSAR